MTARKEYEMAMKPPRLNMDQEFEIALEAYANKLSIPCSSCRGRSIICIDNWVIHSDMACSESVLCQGELVAKMYCYDCQSSFYAHIDPQKLSANNFH